VGTWVLVPKRQTRRAVRRSKAFRAANAHLAISSARPPLGSRRHASLSGRPWSSSVRLPRAHASRSAANSRVRELAYDRLVVTRSRVIIGLVAGLAIVLVVALSIIVGFLGPGIETQEIRVGPGHRVSVEKSPEAGGFNWELAALFGTALGTTLLAVATGVLAFSTFQDVRAAQHTATAIAEQVKLQTSQVTNERTPLVYPVTFLHEIQKSPRRLPLKNGGRGLARRVRGWIIWNDGSERDVWPSVAILPTVLASGEAQAGHLDGRVDNWVDASGVLDYEDVAGVAWRTYFEVRQSDKNEELFVDVKQIQPRALTGDPSSEQTSPHETYAPAPFAHPSSSDAAAPSETHD